MTGNVAVTGERGCAVVRLFGDVDYVSADQLEQEILTVTRAAAGVVIDLTPVTFLDSAGLRCLDRVVAAFDKRQARVRVVAPAAGMVRFTLDLIGFLPELLASTVDEALTDLNR